MSQTTILGNDSAITRKQGKEQINYLMNILHTYDS
jgi:hypothetical protein